MKVVALQEAPLSGRDLAQYIGKDIKKGALCNNRRVFLRFQVAQRRASPVEKREEAGIMASNVWRLRMEETRDESGKNATSETFNA